MTSLEKFLYSVPLLPKEAVERLLKEEKQQITDAWKDGCYNVKDNFPKTAEEYYNKTFKNE